jgi:hypothetical protein
VLERGAREAPSDVVELVDGRTHMAKRGNRIVGRRLIRLDVCGSAEPPRIIRTPSDRVIVIDPFWTLSSTTSGRTIASARFRSALARPSRSKPKPRS